MAKTETPTALVLVATRFSHPRTCTNASTTHPPKLALAKCAYERQLLFNGYMRGAPNQWFVGGLLDEKRLKSSDEARETFH